MVLNACFTELITRNIFLNNSVLVLIRAPMHVLLVLGNEELKMEDHIRPADKRKNNIFV